MIAEEMEVYMMEMEMYTFPILLPFVHPHMNTESKKCERTEEG